MEANIGNRFTKCSKNNEYEPINKPRNAFFWKKNTPMIRPEVYKCKNCNNNLKVNCDGSACLRCGFPIDMYGYRELKYNDLGTDPGDIWNAPDEKPIEFNANYEENDSHRVRFAKMAKVIRYNDSDNYTNDCSNKNTSDVSGKNTSEVSNDVLEHMHEYDYYEFDMTHSVLSYLCLF